MKNAAIPLLTLLAGVLLNGVGILSFMLSESHPTALIPAFCGGLFLVLGGVALFHAKLRPHFIHGALLLALILGLYSAYKVVVVLMENDSALKMFSFETTAMICLGYVALGIMSFRKARRLRRAQATTETAPAPASADAAPADA